LIELKNFPTFKHLNIQTCWKSWECTSVRRNGCRLKEL